MNKNKSIFIIHKDWSGKCCLENNKIYRLENKDEYGDYNIDKNKLIIKWEKWNEEIFYCVDSYTYYLSNIYEKDFENKTVFDKENIFYIILNKNKNEFIVWETKIMGSYILINNILTIKFKNMSKEYLKFNNNIFYINDEIYFNLVIENNLIEETYIYNKLTNIFYNINDINNSGDYRIVDNCIYMNWNNGFKKKFYTNKYLSYNNINNIKILKPNNIFIGDKVLFSNISLCKKNIILSSLNYNKDLNLNDINIKITNQNIIKRTVYNNDDNYEPSFNIILEIETQVNNVTLLIYYEKKKYEIYLEQLNIIDHNISAMTLFKDDYSLLKRYLKYYENLGVNVFYIYYNKKIDHNIIENIIKLNEYNSKIYLTEWNYMYWWKNDNNIKYHHHAQTMAVNDSLNILKNYSNYVLYNDLDEYFLLGEYNNFNNLINENNDVDIFVFKNRFCKMGEEPIKYQDFDEKFDLSKIIKGNYWDIYREKNLIKLENINVMGIHKYFKKFNNNEIIEKVVNEFYHIINFEEKNREILMMEYIF